MKEDRNGIFFEEYTAASDSIMEIDILVLKAEKDLVHEEADEAVRDPAVPVTVRSLQLDSVAGKILKKNSLLVRMTVNQDIVIMQEMGTGVYKE